MKKLIEQVKLSAKKFVDPDFGPNENDKDGAMALYGAKLPDPSGSKYPPPNTLRWARPKYYDATEVFTEDQENEEEEDDEYASRSNGNDDSDEADADSVTTFLHELIVLLLKRNSF